MNEDGPHLRAAPPRKSAGLAAGLGWILPGLGQAYVGRPGKGLFFFTVIVGTFTLGLALGDWRCVHHDRHEVWFFAQALAAAPTAVAAFLTRSLEVTRAIPLLDVGLLYTSIAGLLNAVAISDAIGHVEEIAEARRDAIERDDMESLLEPPLPFEPVLDGSAAGAAAAEGGAPEVATEPASAVEAGIPASDAPPAAPLDARASPDPYAAPPEPWAAPPSAPTREQGDAVDDAVEGDGRQP